MIPLYGQSVGTDIDENYIIWSENWLVKKNDQRNVDYEALPNGEYFVKYISDPDIDKIEEVEKKYAISFNYFRSITY